MDDARATYEQGRKTHEAEVARLDSRARAIGTLRLLLAAVALGLVGAIVWAHAGVWGGGGIAVALVAFAVCVVLHARVLEARERSAAVPRTM